jgi:hypothetical protein
VLKNISSIGIDFGMISSRKRLGRIPKQEIREMKRRRP